MLTINIFLKIWMIFVNQCRTYTGCPNKQNKLEDNPSKGIPGLSQDIEVDEPVKKKNSYLKMSKYFFQIQPHSKNAKLPCKI